MSKDDGGESVSSALLWLHSVLASHVQGAGNTLQRKNQNLSLLGTDILQVKKE